MPLLYDRTRNNQDHAERLGGRASLVDKMDAGGVLQNASDERLEAEVLRMRAIVEQTGGWFVYS